MCQLAVPGAVSFPEAAARDDTDGSGLMAGRRVRGLRSSCSASHKAALMPMIPQRGAEEPFDDTLEAIDAAIDAELEEQHHALPLRHKKKVCRSPRRPLRQLVFVPGTTQQRFFSAEPCTLRTPMLFDSTQDVLNSLRSAWHPKSICFGLDVRFLYACRLGAR